MLPQPYHAFRRRHHAAAPAPRCHQRRVTVRHGERFSYYARERPYMPARPAGTYARYRPQQVYKSLGEY